MCEWAFMNGGWGRKLYMEPSHRRAFGECELVLNGMKWKIKDLILGLEIFKSGGL